MPFVITFKHGGAIEFGQAILALGSRAVKVKNYEKPEPPKYDYYQGPAPAYVPPYQDPYYNFVQQNDAFAYPDRKLCFSPIIL